MPQVVVRGVYVPLSRYWPYFSIEQKVMRCVACYVAARARVASAADRLGSFVDRWCQSRGVRRWGCSSMVELFAAERSAGHVLKAQLLDLSRSTGTLCSHVTVTLISRLSTAVSDGSTRCSDVVDKPKQQRCNDELVHSPRFDSGLSQLQCEQSIEICMNTT